MSGSKKALAMWGVQQLTLAGEAIPESTKKAAGDGFGVALASAKSKTPVVENIAEEKHPTPSR